MSFSDNLHYLRKRDKITQEDLADRLGVSRQSVSKWETGEAYPETDKLITLCDMFGVSMDDLVRGEVTEKAEASRADGKELIRRTDRFSKAIACGVFLILFGVSVCVLLSGVALTLEQNIANITAVMGAVAVILFVAAAVFLFIFFGMEYDRFRKANPVVDGVYGEEETRAFSRRFAITMACLVSGILLDVIFLVVFTSLIDADIIAVANKDQTYCFVTAAFLFVLAFIVGGLVSAGISHTKYNVEEYNKQNHGENSPRAKLKEAICGAVMLSATALFLVLGFVWGLWHPGWVVFPVGGIICGIIGTVMGVNDDRDD